MSVAHINQGSNFNPLILELTARLEAEERPLTTDEVRSLINEPLFTNLNIQPALGRPLTAREVFNRACVFFDIQTSPTLIEDGRTCMGLAEYRPIEHEVALNSNNLVAKINKFVMRFLGRLRHDELIKLIVSHEVVHASQYERFNFLTRAEFHNFVEEFATR